MTATATAVNTGAPSAQEAGFEALTAEIVKKIDTRFSALDATVQKRFTEQAAEIARLDDTARENDTAYRERYRALLRGGERAVMRSGYFASPQQAAAIGKLIAQASLPHEAQNYALTAAELPLVTAALGGHEKAAVSLRTGPAGGFLLTDDVVAEVMNNLERYGVASRLIRPIEIRGDVVQAPRLSTGATTYFPDEGAAPTESQLKFSSVSIAPTRFSTLVIFDRWMLASLPTLATFVFDEMQRSLGQKEDECVFIGDGTSTYAKHKGVFQRTGNAANVTADAGDNTYVECIAASTKYLQLMVGGVPDLVDAFNPSFFGHRSIFFGYMGARDTTGRPLGDLLAGGVRELWGYPYERTQVTAKLADGSQASKAMLAFGPLGRAWRAARHISRVELRQSEHVKFLEGQIAVVLDVLERFEEVDPTLMSLLITNAA